MNILNINDIDDKSDFSIAVINGGVTTYVAISEGTGDNLSKNDTDLGYVDYINYTTYQLQNGEFSEVDGGMVLLNQLYMFCSPEHIIEIMADELDVNNDNTSIICLPYDATSSYYEDVAGINMDDFPYDTQDDDLLDIYNRIISVLEEYGT